MAAPWERYQQADGPWSKYGSSPAQEINTDPTADMGTIERLRAGIGRGMASAARGVGNLVGLVSDADVAEAKRLDAALLNTTAGKVGNVVGLAGAALPTALIPGANTAMGATLIGAGTGAVTTEGGAMDRLQAAGMGAAGGLVGKYAGEAIGTGARKLADMATQRFTAAQAQNAQRMAAAQAGREMGAVVPPADLPGAGMVTEALSGLSGKIKTAQVASARNQPIWNARARGALGVADDAPLTPDVLQSLRNAAADKGYTPIRSAGEVTTSPEFGKALDAIAGQYQGAARSFPGAAKNPVVDMVEGLRQPKFDAGDGLDMVKVLREQADAAYRAGQNNVGKAAKSAATALEEEIGRHLKDSGNEAALAAFREARKEIAKTYSVQKALNPQTGDVSAAALAKQLDKGAPLSGDLLRVAQFAQANPRAAQMLKEAPKATSPLDWAVGALGAGSANPMAGAVVAVRPGVRSLLLSDLVQKRAMKEATGPGLTSQLPAALLDQNLTRRAFPGLLGILSARAGAGDL